VPSIKLPTPRRSGEAQGSRPGFAHRVRRAVAGLIRRRVGVPDRGLAVGSLPVQLGLTVGVGAGAAGPAGRGAGAGFHAPLPVPAAPRQSIARCHGASARGRGGRGGEARGRGRGGEARGSAW
jgi:hypothetical protein